MAEVPVMINGILFDKQWKTYRPVVLFGAASIAGLEIGGGPIIPPPGSPGDPPGIWGPPGPWPTPPIHLPPGWESGRPPVIWGGGNEPFPTPPIVIPGPPVDPPTEPIPPGEGIKPPPPGGGWGYSPTYGWGFFPGTGLVAGPKTPKK